jgi:hypothetical protein
MRQQRCKNVDYSLRFAVDYQRLNPCLCRVQGLDSSSFHYYQSYIFGSEYRQSLWLLGLPGLPLAVFLRQSVDHS